MLVTDVGLMSQVIILQLPGVVVNFGCQYFVQHYSRYFCAAGVFGMRLTFKLVDLE